jgi:cellulose synthase/poly-beta-1,6-N-acetylglucosamine synthase-like glycosyltransferase
MIAYGKVGALLDFAVNGKRVSNWPHGQGDPRVRLSVVIPALNEERHLGYLLSDLQRQTRSPDEVIVVDAGSGDASVRIAEQSHAAVLHGGRPSPVVGTWEVTARRET